MTSGEYQVSTGPDEVAQDALIGATSHQRHSTDAIIPFLLGKLPFSRLDISETNFGMFNPVFMEGVANKTCMFNLFIEPF